MRPYVLYVSLALLLAACAATEPAPTTRSPSAPATIPTAGPSAPATTAPVTTAPGTPGGLVWELYHSDDLVFSLQLPRGWSAARTGTAEGQVLRASAEGEGSLLVTIDIPEEEIPFEQYVRESFRSLLERDPNAVQAVELPGGLAARAVSPREGGGVSVIYLFAPRGGHAKSLAFTWDQDEPNPLWAQIARRFNAYSPQPIIEFITPSPGGD